MEPELNRQALEELFVRAAVAVREAHEQAERCRLQVAQTRRLLNTESGEADPDEPPRPRFRSREGRPRDPPSVRLPRRS
jgi:hypothetical protein